MHQNKKIESRKDHAAFKKSLKVCKAGAPSDKGSSLSRALLLKPVLLQQILFYIQKMLSGMQDGAPG